MRPETKASIKTVLLFAITLLSATLILAYFHTSNSRLKVNRAVIERQQSSLALIDSLINSIDKTQRSLQVYPAGREALRANVITQYISRVDSIAGKLSIIYKEESSNLKELPRLLYTQYENIKILNSEFKENNRLEELSTKLKSAKEYRDTSVYVTQINDTVISLPPRRGFFRRFADLFSPKKDTVITVNARFDTVKRINPDTLNLYSEADDLAMEALSDYNKSLESIVKRINVVITANSRLAYRIYSILYELNGRMLGSVLESVSVTEREADSNYALSLAGGVLALLVIIYFAITIINDIKVAQKASRAIEQANRKILEVMESRHKLMLATSHDIKSPLNSIIGYLEFIEGYPAETGSMKNSAKYILALLENMLNFSSIEQGTLTVTKSEFDSNTVLTEICGMFKPLADAKQLHFSCNRLENGVIISDEMKLRQILINLVSNAVKYTVKGGVTIYACVDKSSEGNNLLNIKVSDTGAGIEDKDMDKLFKPFVRVEKNNTLAKGSGYGMFVVKGLVELLGGTIDVDSKVNEGTTFTVSIPVSLPDKNSCREEKKLISCKRIVVFDDEPDVVNAVSSMLVSIGICIDEDDYDCILTDMDMCGITGFDVLASAGGVPVVLMSGRGDITEEIAIKEGFAAFIPKPVTIDKLKAVFTGNV